MVRKLAGSHWFSLVFLLCLAGCDGFAGSVGGGAGEPGDPSFEGDSGVAEATDLAVRRGRCRRCRNRRTDAGTDAGAPAVDSGTGGMGSTTTDAGPSSVDSGASGMATRYLGLGIKGDQRGDLEWIRETGTPFDYRYGYLAGGVNTGAGWADWESPRGQYLTRFLEDSRSNGLAPVLSYYQIVQSNPNGYQEPPYGNVQNASTMRAYFADWRLALERAAAFGGPVIFHHEPDLWGYFQQQSTDPTRSPVAVASSGSPDVAGFENNARGFAQAIVSMRNRIAPNVTLAYHASHWVTQDLYRQNGDGRALGNALATYFQALQADFDQIFFGTSDRDSAWRVIVRGQTTRGGTRETSSDCASSSTRFFPPRIERE